jgi:hypothetical protein
VDGVGGASGGYNFALLASNERLRTLASKKTTPSSTAPPTSVPVAKPKPPKTEIKGRRIDRSDDLVAFDLGSDPKGSTFRCKLDKGKFAKCGAKVTYRHLAPGPHTFEAEAVGPTGLTDATPARAKFTFAKHRPKRHP